MLVVIYVAAFATTTGIFRPIAGTLLLIAIVWALTWVVRTYRASEQTTAQLALYLAMISLTIGAILGVLLGIFVANGSIPGLSTERAATLAGAHPVAMLIGYLILAGVAISHWVLEGGQGILGRLVAWALFLAGLIANVAFIFDIEALIQVFSALQVIAIIAYVVHMWGKITPGAWGVTAPTTSDEWLCWAWSWGLASWSTLSNSSPRANWIQSPEAVRSVS